LRKSNNKLLKYFFSKAKASEIYHTVLLKKNKNKGSANEQ